MSCLEFVAGSLTNSLLSGLVENVNTPVTSQTYSNYHKWKRVSEGFPPPGSVGSGMPSGGHKHLVSLCC